MNVRRDRAGKKLTIYTLTFLASSFEGMYIVKDKI